MWFFQLNFFLRIKKVGIPGLISWRKKITVKHADVTWTLLQQKRFPKLWNKLGLNVGWHFLAYHLNRYVLCRIIMVQKINFIRLYLYQNWHWQRFSICFPPRIEKWKTMISKLKSWREKRLKILDAASSQVSTTLAA